MNRYKILRGETPPPDPPKPEEPPRDWRSKEICLRLQIPEAPVGMRPNQMQMWVRSTRAQLIEQIDHQLNEQSQKLQSNDYYDILHRELERQQTPQIWGEGLGTLQQQEAQRYWGEESPQEQAQRETERQQAVGRLLAEYSAMNQLHSGE